MEIVINTETLEENQLTVGEYCTLYMMWKNMHMKATYLVEDVDFEKLESDGYMKRHGTEFEDWVVRDKFLQLVTTDDNHMWYEFCKVMPFKVPNGTGGHRMLRAKDPDVQGNVKIKKKYLTIVSGKPDLHKKIIQCIEIELENNRAKLQFMQATEAWLNQRTWEKWEHMIEEEQERIAEGPNYGKSVI